MSNDRPKGSYSGPLSLQWCAYSMTVRAMPMNYLAADLSRIDAALWGRESEIGAAIAEAPAMVEALREVTKALGEIDDYPMATGLSPDVQNNALDKAFAILSRIDGAGDTLPDAPAPAPTGEEPYALKAARGYASNPEQWNPPSPEQMAEILAMIDAKGEN